MGDRDKAENKSSGIQICIIFEDESSLSKLDFEKGMMLLFINPRRTGGRGVLSTRLEVFCQ